MRSWSQSRSRWDPGEEEKESKRIRLKITPVNVFPSPETEFQTMERILPDANIHHHHHRPLYSSLSVSEKPECLSNAGASDTIQKTLPVEMLVDEARKPEKTWYQYSRLMRVWLPRQPKPNVFHLIISGKSWKKRISSQPSSRTGETSEKSRYLNQLTTSPDLNSKSLWYIQCFLPFWLEVAKSL